MNQSWWRRWAKGLDRRWRYVAESPTALVCLGVSVVLIGLSLFLFEGFISGTEVDSGALRGFPPEPRPIILSMDVKTQQEWPVLPDASPNHQFVICSKMGNEVPYLIEWIEFHRLQGVDRFALYADDSVVSPQSQLSSQQIALIKAAYDDIGHKDLIDFYSVSSFLGEVQYDLLDPAVCNHTTTEMHRLSQQSLLKHCKETYQHLTEWIIHIDGDEFLHAPLHDSLSSFFHSLYDESPEANPRESFAPNYRVGNISGIYVWPVSYGLSSGRLLDPRVALRSSAATGRAEISFDPRTAEATDHELFKRLSQEAPSKPSALATFKTFLSDERLNPYFRKASWEDLWLAKDKVKALWAKATQLAEGAAGDSPEPNMVFAREVEKAFAEMRADAYPLVIDEQRRRMPSLDYGDDFETVARAIIETYPDCREYIELLLQPENARLRSKVAEADRVKKLGKAPFPYCVPGDLPNGLTNLGKSLLWTGHRYKPPSTFNVPQAYAHKGELDSVDSMNRFSRRARPRRNPRLDKELGQREQCLQPWVHICSHKTWSPYLSASVATQLRLDHHMLRSLESRTVADAKWRSNGWGKFMVENKKLDFSVMDFATVIEDDIKVKYVPKIRSALAQLNLRLMSAEVAMPEGAKDIRTTWYVGDCDLGKLLLRQQHTCPSSYPYVGFFGHRVPPPSALTPLGWCTNQTSYDINWYFQHYAPVEDFERLTDDSDRGHQIRREIAENFLIDDIALCPGVPNTDCCDYSAKAVEIIQTFMQAYGASEAYNKTVSRELQVKHWWRPAILNYIGQD